MYVQYLHRILGDVWCGLLVLVPEQVTADLQISYTWLHLGHGGCATHRTPSNSNRMWNSNWNFNLIQFLIIQLYCGDGQ